jgi:hypothetical protein
LQLGGGDGVRRMGYYLQNGIKEILEYFEYGKQAFFYSLCQVKWKDVLCNTS